MKYLQEIQKSRTKFQVDLFFTCILEFYNLQIQWNVRMFPNSALKIISSLPPSWKSVENSTNNKFLKLALIKLFESLGGKIQTAKYNDLIKLWGKSKSNIFRLLDELWSYPTWKLPKVKYFKNRKKGVSSKRILRIYWRPMVRLCTAS